MHTQVKHQINHGLIYMDTGADQNFPVDRSSEDGLWDQGNVQLAMPLTSKCCGAMIVEHKGEPYCTGCAASLSTGEVSDVVENLITH